MRARLHALALAGAALVSTGADALDLARGKLPLSVENSAVVACGARCELVIEGEIKSAAPATLVLRMDDARSTSYATRLNEERELPAGSFRWRRPMAGLRTSGGRALDLASLSRVMLFLASGNADVIVTRMALVEAKSLPEGALGLSFGAPEAAVPQGFERVSPGDPRIGGQSMTTVSRPQPDPLVANGVKGLERIRLDWPNGRVRVSFWTEDPGEWETLPHPLGRRIRVNGEDVLLQRFTPAEWVAKRYLAGADREAGPGETAWSAFGQHRGELATAEVEVRDKGLEIDLAGDSPDATFLSALLVEPAGGRDVLDGVLRQRAAWYDETWRIGAPSLTRLAHEASALVTGDQAAQEAPALMLTLAPGSGRRASFVASTDAPLEAPEIVVNAPALGGRNLRVRIWAAQRVLDRANAGSTLLTLKDDRLRANAEAAPLTPEQPRRYELWIDAPQDVPPGLYSGDVTIRAGRQAARLPLAVDVLPVILPPAPRAAGFYLDEAPHLSWFPWRGDARRRQIACDLDVLAGLGIEGNAPALSTPAAKRNEEFISDARLASQGSTVAPWLAYAPAKRIVQSVGPIGGAEVIAEADRALSLSGMKGAIWSVADEPGNPDQSGSGLPAWVAALRRAEPGVKLAAHLNRKEDRAAARLFDTVLINEGFGVDVDDVAGMRAAHVDPWLYNTGRPRWTAGFWLWRTGASRYLQWHARMPTADPFDPTDGREGDVQMFLPTLEPCPAQPDINGDVLAMAEGLVDQRWLAWLARRREPAAQALLAELQTLVGDHFPAARTPDDVAIEALRDRIVTLARRLN